MGYGHIQCHTVGEFNPHDFADITHQLVVNIYSVYNSNALGCIARLSQLNITRSSLLSYEPVINVRDHKQEYAYTITQTQPHTKCQAKTWSSSDCRLLALQCDWDCFRFNTVFFSCI